jgi:hypothetical protein
LEYCYWVIEQYDGQQFYLEKYQHEGFLQYPNLDQSVKKRIHPWSQETFLSQDHPKKPSNV